MTLKVPVEKVDEVASVLLCLPTNLKTLFPFLRTRSSCALKLEPPVQEPSRKLKSGDVYQVAEVVRALLLVTMRHFQRRSAQYERAA